MRIEEIDKIRLQNIEMGKIPSPNEIPDYLMDWFCCALNYHVKKYVEEQREKEQLTNNHKTSI